MADMTELQLSVLCYTHCNKIKQIFSFATNNILVCLCQSTSIRHFGYGSINEQNRRAVAMRHIKLPYEMATHRRHLRWYRPRPETQRQDASFRGTGLRSDTIQRTPPETCADKTNRICSLCECGEYLHLYCYSSGSSMSSSSSSE